MITDIIDILRGDNYYGGGKHIEIAKGKNELITTWKGLKRKATRQWRSQEK